MLFLSCIGCLTCSTVISLITFKILTLAFSIPLNIHNCISACPNFLSNLLQSRPCNMVLDVVNDILIGFGSL